MKNYVGSSSVEDLISLAAGASHAFDTKQTQVDEESTLQTLGCLESRLLGQAARKSRAGHLAEKLARAQNQVISTCGMWDALAFLNPVRLRLEP